MQSTYLPNHTPQSEPIFQPDLCFTKRNVSGAVAAATIASIVVTEEKVCTRKLFLVYNSGGLCCTDVYGDICEIQKVVKKENRKLY